jgi:hypothetical protein
MVYVGKNGTANQQEVAMGIVAMKVATAKPLIVTPWAIA